MKLEENDSTSIVTSSSSWAQLEKGLQSECCQLSFTPQVNVQKRSENNELEPQVIVTRLRRHPYNDLMLGRVSRTSGNLVTPRTFLDAFLWNRFVRAEITIYAKSKKGMRDALTGAVDFAMEPMLTDCLSPCSNSSRCTSRCWCPKLSGLSIDQLPMVQALVNLNSSGSCTVTIYSALTDRDRISQLKRFRSRYSQRCDVDILSITFYPNPCVFAWVCSW